ncbi:MAG: ABC transporter ATP-binding protein [Chloroflexota bacterium]|nr:ABC transporter ATP-binding protein [Chloroflexota bacterium]
MMMHRQDWMLQSEARKAKSAGATLARFWFYFKRYWFVLLSVAALVIATTYMQVLTPDLLGQAVDCYLTPATAKAFSSSNAAFPVPTGTGTRPATNCWLGAPGPQATTNDYIAGLGALVLLLVGLYIASSLLTGLQFYLMNSTGFRVLRNMRVDIFRHIHRLSLGYFSEHEAGDVMSRITNDADTVQQAIGFPLVSVIQGILLIVWIAASMLDKSWAYALISLVMVPFMFFATSWFSNQARKAYRNVRVQVGNVNANLQERISSVRESQAFGREEENIVQFNESNAASRDASIRAVAFTSALSPTLEAMGYVSIAIVAGVGGWLLLQGQNLFGTTMSLGLIITFIAYTQRFNQPISQISVMWTNIQSAIAGAERIFGLLDTEPDLIDQPNAREMPPIKGRVELEHVYAEYKPGESVLCDVNLVAEPGQTVAIVGPTGAGKTTISNLVPRFYEVTSGAVKIDGIDVRDVTAASLRAQVAIVLQDPFLFSDTVMANIRYGKPDATDEQVIAAAKLARADTFIERLPEGYNTKLGERGGGLSQGQRQLISIARAALANPRILILDEATSSVDTRTERLIQKALEELLRGRTSIVIAHRLSTIRNADQVLVLNDGQIIERGKHDELMQAGGFYHDLYMSQFRREEQPQGIKAAVPVQAS